MTVPAAASTVGEPVAFATERLDMRPWRHTESDLRRIYDIYSRWEVAQWLGANPRVVESLDQASAAVDRWSARTEGVFGLWAAEVRETGVVAGTVLLVPLPESDEVEVGWHFHPDSWGHGYATEAARGAVARGFAAGLSEIYAVVRPGNDRSVAVCHRLGMTPIGRTTRWYDTELDAFRLAAPTA